MTHITMTSYKAGTPYCQCDKAVARANGDEFAHMPYCVIDLQTLEQYLSRIDACPECAKIAREVYAED